MSFDAWYLATPYGKYPEGLEAAFDVSCQAAAVLIRAGVIVYSPIVYTHSIAVRGDIDPRDYTIWQPVDKPFVEGCKGIIVLKAKSWESSVGIAHEIEEFTRQRKPVIYMDPYVVPLELQSTKA